MLVIDDKKCTACGVCMESCLFGAIEIKEGVAAINDRCVACGACIKECPQDAIYEEGGADAGIDLDGYEGFMVVGEMDETSGIKKVTLELLSEARRLADKRGQNVSCVLLCDRLPAGAVDQIGKTGCDTVYLYEDSALAHYSTDVYSHLVIDIIKKYKPETVLFPASENGRDLAPRVACRLKTGLTADCTALDIDTDGNLLQIRPTYGGNILATIVTPRHRPQMASVRPNVMRIDERMRAGRCDVSRVDIAVDSLRDRARYIGKKEKDIIFKDITDAQVIIAGGYGMKNAGNFTWIYKVAAKLGAAAGASRKAVDEGWAPADIQIGQTGKTIAPDLYIACGISGALQHSIGLKNAKKVISINNDPAAPIFALSDVALIGDATSILKEIYTMLNNE